MSNTKVDNYIDTLMIGDEIEFEGQTMEIISFDQYDCTLLNEEGEDETYDWGDIAVELQFNGYDDDNS